MARYLKMNLTIELDDDIDEDTLEKLYEFVPAARLSSKENIILDGRQVVLDWGAMEMDKPFVWTDVEDFYIDEY